MSEVLNALTQSPVDRRAERTHLFLVATLYFGRASSVVRVRNLSASGALIEGADLPAIGTEIILRRGELEAHGTAAWVGSGKAGLSFAEPLAVAAWLPAKEAKRQPPVDPATYGVSPPRGGSVAAPPPIVEARLSMMAAVADLAALQADLGQLRDKLSRDISVLARYPELQLIETAGQRIGKILHALRTTQG